MASIRHDFGARQAWPVHGVCGIWGTLSLGLFACGEYAAAGSSPTGIPTVDASNPALTGLFYGVCLNPFLLIFKEPQNSVSQQFSACAEIQFSLNVLPVSLDGFDTNMQCGCDLAGAFSIAYQLKHFHFAVSKAIFRNRGG